MTVALLEQMQTPITKLVVFFVFLLSQTAFIPVWIRVIVVTDCGMFAVAVVNLKHVELFQNVGIF